MLSVNTCLYKVVCCSLLRAETVPGMQDCLASYWKGNVWDRLETEGLRKKHQPICCVLKCISRDAHINEKLSKSNILNT